MIRWNAVIRNRLHRFYSDGYRVFYVIAERLLP